MKRIVVLALSLFMMMAAQAKGDQIQVSGGNPKVLMQSGKTMTLEFDYTDLKIEGKPAQEYLQARGDDFVADFPEDNRVAREWFVERWNDESKKFVNIVESGSADYSMKIHITELDLGNVAAALWSLSGKGGGIVISGTITVTDAEGKRVATFAIDNYRGNSTRGFDMKVPNERRRRAIGYKSFCKDLLNVIKQAK